MAEWGGRPVRLEPGDRSVPDSSPCSHCSHQPGLVGDEALLCKDCQVRSDVIILSPSDIWLRPRLVIPVDSINPYKQLEIFIIDMINNIFLISILLKL